MLIEHNGIRPLCLPLFCFSGKSVMVLFFCDFQISSISFLINFFWITFSGDGCMADDTAFPFFLDGNNIENLVICTGNTETPTKQLLHGVEKDKLRSRKETLSKCRVHTRKSDGNDSSFNSYEQVTGDENLTKICLLFTLYNHCTLALQFFWFSQGKERVMFRSITCVLFIFWSWNFVQRFPNCYQIFNCPNTFYENKELWAYRYLNENVIHLL